VCDAQVEDGDGARELLMTAEGVQRGDDWTLSGADKKREDVLYFY
jgi:hypothetical protein